MSKEGSCSLKVNIYEKQDPKKSVNTSEENIIKFIPLLTVADYRMEVGLIVTLYSALRNLEPGYGLDIRVLSGAVGYRAIRGLKKSLKTLKKPFKITIIKISDKSFKGFRAFANTSLFTYARFLFQDMFTDIGKVIYLDVDVLVLGNLAEFYMKPVGGKLLAAVRGRTTKRADHCWGILNYKELGIPPETPYFNAGVLLMDLDEWRRVNFARQCMEYAAKHPELCIFWDQTVMNTLIAGNFTHLEEKWNQQFNGPDKSYTMDGILHFCGGDKPWNYSNLLTTEIKKLFFDTLDHTALQGWRPQPVISFLERVIRKVKKTLYGF